MTISPRKSCFHWNQKAQGFIEKLCVSKRMAYNHFRIYFKVTSYEKRRDNSTASIILSQALQYLVCLLSLHPLESAFTCYNRVIFYYFRDFKMQQQITKKIHLLFCCEFGQEKDIHLLILLESCIDINKISYALFSKCKIFKMKYYQHCLSQRRRRDVPVVKILAVSEDKTSQFSSFLLAGEFCVNPPDGNCVSRGARGPSDGLQVGNVQVRKGCQGVTYPLDLMWFDCLSPISFFS